MMDERNQQITAVTQALRTIVKGVQAHSKNVEKSCGLSSASLWMLHEVAGLPGIKVSKLASVLSVHPSTCSNMLDKLEEKQLIYRDRSKTDQRTVHIHVTEEGRQFLQTAPRPAQGKLTSALEQLSPTDLTKLANGLDALLQALHVGDDRTGSIPMIGE